jgi:xanthine/uracil permease
MKKTDILRGALFFVAALIVGELTFGNPDFILTVWYFPDTPAWQWSLPVHAVGFFWMLICVRLFRNSTLFWPVVFSTLFFFIGESLNWYTLNIFQYGGRSEGARMVSFWTVIAMYFLLCTTVLLILRRGRWRAGPEDAGDSSQ